MNIAEWILVAFLSVALLVFLIIGIVALVKWNKLVDETKKIVIKGQDIAETTNDIAENVKGMTSFGNIIRTVSDTVANNIDKKPKKNPKK